MFLKNKYVSLVALSCLSLSLYAAPPARFYITNHTDCVCTQTSCTIVSSKGGPVYVGELKDGSFINTKLIGIGPKVSFDPSATATNIELSKINPSTPPEPKFNYPIKQFAGVPNGQLTMVTLGTGENPQVFLAPTKWVIYSSTACSLKTPTHLRLSQSF